MRRIPLERRRWLSIWLGPINLAFMAVNLLLLIPGPDWLPVRLGICAVQLLLLAVQIAAGVSAHREHKRWLREQREAFRSRVGPDPI